MRAEIVRYEHRSVDLPRIQLLLLLSFVQRINILPLPYAFEGHITPPIAALVMLESLSTLLTDYNGQCQCTWPRAKLPKQLFE